MRSKDVKRRRDAVRRWRESRVQRHGAKSGSTGRDGVEKGQEGKVCGDGMERGSNEEDVERGHEKVASRDSMRMRETA